MFGLLELGSPRHHAQNRVPYTRNRNNRIMTEQEIIQLIHAQLPDAEVSPAGEGCNFSIRVVSSAFAGKSMLEQHRMVNKALSEAIRSGALHAVTLDTRTPDNR